MNNLTLYKYEYDIDASASSSTEHNTRYIVAKSLADAAKECEKPIRDNIEIAEVSREVKVV